MNRLLNRANKKISLGGAATLLICVALIGQLLGFVRTRLLSANFTKIDPGLTDAYYFGFLIPDFFYYTIAAGALGVAFMPIIADKLAKADKKAVWDITSSLLNTLAIAMGVVAVVILVFASPLIHKLAPDLPANHQQEAINIMRLLAFNPLMFAISGIFSTVQQSYGRFFFYAITTPIYNIVIILSIFVFRNDSNIVGVGAGAVVAGLVQLLVAMLGLYGLGFKYRPKINWGSHDFKKVLKQLPPRSLDQGIDQVNGIVELNRAQTLGVGPVTHYNFAWTLHNVPVMLLGNAISTAAFPRMTARLAQGRHDLFRRDFLQILRVMVWLTAPVVVIAYFCRGYLARIVYSSSAKPVSTLLGFLSVAIFFRVMYSMLSRYFYAHKDTRTPLLVSIFAIALNIFLVFTLVRKDGYGASGLAIAQALVAASEVIILFTVMVIRDPQLIQRVFWGGVGRIMSVTGFTVMTAYIMLGLLPLQAADTGFVTLGSKLAIISIAVLSVHLFVSWLFELEEAQAVITKAKKMINRPVKIQ